MSQKAQYSYPPRIDSRTKQSMMWVKFAGVLGALSIAMGAFGAHALRGRVAPNLLDAYQTGAQYHLAHAIALLALAFYGQSAGQSITLPASLWLAGILLFSGSLYAMAITGVTRLGIITPIGGIAFLVGWLSLLTLKA